MPPNPRRPIELLLPVVDPAEHLVKPVEPTRLLEAIAKALEQAGD